MRLCDTDRLLQLMEVGELHIQSSDGSVIFLDGFRVGLRLQNRLDTIESVDLSQPQNCPITSRPLFDIGMARGEWGLAFSVERLSLSWNIIGFMNTRSKYARLGLETMGSSWLVAPGFGLGDPTSLVFEMVAHTCLRAFSAQEAYAYVMFFELDSTIRADRRNYGDRFPFVSVIAPRS